jgi:hypothetical protein
VQKLGKNLGRYLGETIDVPSLLGQIAQAGESHGWTKELIGEIGSFPVVAWHRQAVGPTETSRRIYISAGIHGDEPASPLAALRLLQENRWPANVETFLVPCLNPVGFTLNQRENGEGIDLNRDYRNPRTPTSPGSSVSRTSSVIFASTKIGNLKAFIFMNKIRTESHPWPKPSWIQ